MSSSFYFLSTSLPKMNENTFKVQTFGLLILIIQMNFGIKCQNMFLVNLSQKSGREKGYVTIQNWNHSLHVSKCWVNKQIRIVDQ